MALAYCLSPACKRRVKSGRCRQHSPRAFAGHNHSRHERGYGSAHVARRARLIHQHHRCAWVDDQGRRCNTSLACPAKGCGHQGVRAELDHIIPKFDGGSDEDANLRPLCPAHHGPKTRDDAARARRGGGGKSSRHQEQGRSSPEHARVPQMGHSAPGSGRS